MTGLVRFNRDYEFHFGIEGQELIIRPPFNISFDVFKSLQQGVNKGNFKLYGLSESVRLKMNKTELEVDKHIPVKLLVGYAGAMEMIFKGNVWIGKTTREGAEFVVNLESQDGGVDFITAYMSGTFDNKQTAVNAILSSFQYCAKGQIAELDEYIRPRVLVGSSAVLLEDIIDRNKQNWFIDNEVIHIIDVGGNVSDLVPIVSAETGLLKTPERDQLKINFMTMINPSLRIGGLCEMKSVTAPHMNGIYNIAIINYIGEYNGADWRQQVTAILKAT